MAKDLAKVVYLHEHKGKGRKRLLSHTVEEHEAALKRFLRARLANEQDRDDVVQEVFLRLCRLEDAEGKLSYGAASTRSYLFSIATNLIIDMSRRAAARRQGDHCEFDETLMADGAGMTEDVLQHRQELALVRNVLLRIEAKPRQAFILSRFENLSYREIADEMGVSCSMVEKHITKCLVELRGRVGRGKSQNDSK